jgi:hypothetical protein
VIETSFQDALDIRERDGDPQSCSDLPYPCLVWHVSKANNEMHELPVFGREV